MNISVNIPNQINFAQEVRIGRLPVLWKMTLALAGLLIWAALILMAMSGGNPVEIIVPILATFAGCAICRFLLLRNQFEPAVWAYAIGLFITLALLSYTASVAAPAAASA